MQKAQTERPWTWRDLVKAVCAIAIAAAIGFGLVLIASPDLRGSFIQAFEGSDPTSRTVLAMVIIVTGLTWVILRPPWRSRHRNPSE